MTVCLAIDAGTTGVGAVAVDERGARLAGSYRALPPYFPPP